jgi:hypothetical protein
MFIFVRRRTIKAGKLTQALDFAIESSAHVGKVIGKTVAVQRLAYGQPAGVLQFSYLVDQMSEFDESAERIAGDAGAADFASRGAELFEGLPEDNIGRVVVSTFDGPKPVMNIVSAVGAPGKFPEVLAFGVEMQQLLTSTTGEPAAFVTGISGAVGGVRFALGADSMAGLQAANEKLQEGGAFAKLMERTGALFVPASGHTAILRKIN